MPAITRGKKSWHWGRQQRCTACSVLSTYSCVGTEEWGWKSTLLQKERANPRLSDGRVRLCVTHEESKMKRRQQPGWCVRVLSKWPSLPVCVCASRLVNPLSVCVSLFFYRFSTSALSQTASVFCFFPNLLLTHWEIWLVSLFIPACQHFLFLFTLISLIHTEIHTFLEI